MTSQRQVILEEIRKVHSHPTADQVYEEVRKRLPRISLGTVYRNLDILSECGLIQRIAPVSNQMRFDGDTSSHYHVRCIHCGKVEDAPIEPVDGATGIPPISSATSMEEPTRAVVATESPVPPAPSPEPTIDTAAELEITFVT